WRSRADGGRAEAAARRGLTRRRWWRARRLCSRPARTSTMSSTSSSWATSPESLTWCRPTCTSTASTTGSSALTCVSTQSPTSTPMSCSGTPVRSSSSSTTPPSASTRTRTPPPSRSPPPRRR
ncbi:hypothetical protein EE612_054364, partial [Oryza sativa]